MASFDFDDSELVKQLERLENYDELASLMLETAAPVLVNSLKEQLKKHKRTGIMLNSVKASKAQKNAYGWYISVRPTGQSNQYMAASGKIYTRKEKVRNMELLAHLEYGTRTQPATPVITAAHNNCKNEAYRIMQEIYNKEVEG